MVVRDKVTRRGRRSGLRTPIRCRVCLCNMGSIRDFEGQVFMLCEGCEEALRRRKKAGGERREA